MEVLNIARYQKLPLFFFGIAVGLSVAALVFLVITISSLGSNSIPEGSKQAFSLSVKSPSTNQAVGYKEIKVSGFTGRKAVLTIANRSEIKTLETSNATFSTNINLKEGKNTITITAFDPSTGESQSLSREVLYLENEINNL